MFDRDLRHLHILVGLLIVGVLGFFALRQRLLPATWGDKGNYRAAAESEHVARAARVPSRSECVDCHSERVAKEGAPHAKVHCSECHGMSRDHIDDCRKQRELANKAAGVTDKRATGIPKGLKCVKTGLIPTDVQPRCAHCHVKIAGLPPKFPQVVSIEAHLEEQEPEDPEKPNVCLQCHSSHNPAEEPQELPEPEAADEQADDPAPAAAPAQATPAEEPEEPTEPEAESGD